jgi:hypothetical protein
VELPPSLANWATLAEGYFSPRRSSAHAREPEPSISQTRAPRSLPLFRLRRIRNAQRSRNERFLIVFVIAWPLPPFDIFRLEANGEVLWIRSAEDLKSARLALKQFDGIFAARIRDPQP